MIPFKLYSHVPLGKTLMLDIFDVCKKDGMVVLEIYCPFGEHRLKCGVTYDDKYNFKEVVEMITLLWSQCQPMFEKHCYKWHQS